MTPKILHIDMNKFYASVEQMLNPQLKNKAIAVCGSTEERHGIVLTASAEAKARGVKTGMANWEARRACPGLIVVPPQYDQYCKYSKLARAVYGRYSDRIEPYGMDECWVDISPICRTFDEAEKIAHEIRTAIKEELGLTVSIGVSFSKVLAKLGSDMKKPDAVTVLSPGNWEERVWPLPVSELLYVGHSTTRKLMSRGVLTIGDLAHYPCIKAARSAKRVLPRRLDSEADKYHANAWLNRLGFGGAAYKELRRTLMGHLDGYAAFKSEDRMQAHKNKLAEQRRIRRELNEEVQKHD